MSQTDGFNTILRSNLQQRATKREVSRRIPNSQRVVRVNLNLFCSVGVVARLQAAFLQTERRVLPLSAGAEGRRAALHHHRPPGTDQIAFRKFLFSRS